MDAKRLDELIDRALESGVTQFTLFLDPAAARAFVGRAKKAGLEAGFFGGYPDAQRVMCFCGWESEPQYPLTTLEISWDKRFGAVEHHDVLGAVMALGIARERFGDIVCTPERAYLFAQSACAKLIERSLIACGKTPVRTGVCEKAQIEAPKGDLVTATFASLRLDAVLGAALRVSRADAAALVRAGQVNVNFVPCEKPDRPLAQGDVLSIRGRGRAIVREIGGKSRKDRIYTTLEVFLH